MLQNINNSIVSAARHQKSFPVFLYHEVLLMGKGIVINLKEVRELGSDYLILKNGEQLPVSRRLQRQVQGQRLSLSAGSLRGEGI